MRIPESVLPVRMSRIAIVVPRTGLREALVAVGEAGVVDLDRPEERGRRDEHARVLTRAASAGGAPTTSTTDAATGSATPDPRVLVHEPEPAELERAGRADLLAGERELRRIAEKAVVHRGAAVLLGWAPRRRRGDLADRLAGLGASVVELPHPARAEAPTLMAGPRAVRPARPLVDTYGAVPYVDVDPAIFAGLAYVVMFGIMFGDLGHGLVLAALGGYLWRSRRPALARVRPVAPLVVAAGLSAAAFGLVYGEAFGPTIPPLWIEPTEQPTVMLLAGIVVGSVLLGVSYLLGMVNRWREGGLARVLYAPSGIAGASLYLGAAVAAAGFGLGVDGLLPAGAGIAVIGLGLLFVGGFAEAGGGLGGVTQAVIELADGVIRTMTNAVSFVRLAAFGMAHAILAGLVWTAATTLAGSGALGLVLAVLVFVVGNALAFALEALVAGLQAMRLTYYELFSRIFAREGRVFMPWRLAVVTEEGS